MKLSEKKKSVAEKMGTRVMPGYKRKKNEITHERDDHGVVVSFKKANYLHKKGRESLSPSHKGRDNEVMEGKGEKELN